MPEPFTRSKSTTYLLTFSHVLWSVSLFCSSIDSIVSSIFTLSFSTVAIFFFNSASVFSTLFLKKIALLSEQCRTKRTKRINPLVNHIHNLGIDFPLHPSLTFFKFLRFMFKLRDALTPPVILSPGISKLPTKELTSKI